MGTDVGTVVRGCRILERLDEGGMGTVYRARQLALDREVAVKVLHDDMAADAELVKRFYREALAAGRLSHPNIVAVLDTGPHENLHVIVMEYVRGRSVEQLIAEQGAVGVGRSLAIMHGAALGLHAAHQAGIVHRDVKPGNLLLDEHGTVKLADFGIAKLVGGDFTRLTRTDMMLGTLQYASPEQFDGRPVDARSDIYSLGITLYHMLTGARPFESKNTLALIQRHMEEVPPPAHLRNALVPEPVSALAARMIAKDPRGRFQDAGELARAVHALQVSLGYVVEAPSDSILREMGLAPERSAPARAHAVAIALLAAGCGVLGWWLSTRMGE